MKNHLKICIYIVLTTCCACIQKSQPEQLRSTNISNKNTTTAISVNAEKKEMKPIIDFFSLANKTPIQIEKLYGKHSFVDTKIIQFKEGEFRKYKISKGNNEDLQVDFYKGKAVQFFLDIPEKFQSKSLEETIKLCGLNLDLKDAQTTELAVDYWWDKPFKASPFYSVHIKKFSDSGLFYHCEALMRVD